jgi:predicted membrane-bound spermidine synthase
MGLELTAFRLYAPYLGYSIYVWGTMISVVMAALAGGYALGGWLADQTTKDGWLYAAISASGVYQLAIARTAHPILNAVSRTGEITGTLAATCVIFAPPIIALAATSPFVIRLLTETGHVGVTAGGVYALSTVGSIAGVLLTSFYLVPTVGTLATLHVLCATSTLIGLAGLAPFHKGVGKGLALLGIASFSAAVAAPKHASSPNEIWSVESAYNLVRVLRRGSQLLLVLNDESFFQTIQIEGSNWSGNYQDDFAIGTLLTPARRALVLGMGAGGSIRSMQAVAPEIQIDAVEIDQRVIEAGIRFFGLRPKKGTLEIHGADARPWLKSASGDYDIVQVDLYQGGPYIPFYLDTVEFFRAARAHLTKQGLLMMNVYDAGQERELLSCTVATLRAVFPSVLVASKKSGNHMVVAFAQEQSLGSVQAALRVVPGDAPIRVVATRAASSLREFLPRPGTPILTDDQAPLEPLTRRFLASQLR